MNVLFMGTPEFALPSLSRLHDSDHSVVAVVTGEDKPRGRGHRLHPTPVAEHAQTLNIPVTKVRNLRDEATIGKIKHLNVDAVVLVAFGYKIPPTLLQAPPQGCINLHPSLLPKYRGASPIHAPLLAGDEKTGISTMYMDEGLDTGDVILQKTIAIPEHYNAGDLHDELATKGADLVVETLDLIEKGTAPRTVQDDEQASYAPKVVKQAIDWNEPAFKVVRTIRGLSPFPGVHTYWKRRRLNVLNARPDTSSDRQGEPGSIVKFTEMGPVVACNPGAVLLTQLQPAGKKTISGSDFINGFQPTVGGRFS